jgi:hypothetical protein
VQAEAGGVDPAPVVDHDKGVGEFVDRDGGQAQADHGGDLGRVDPQLEDLAGADRGGNRRQPGHGEDDLGGDGGRVEQVPGTTLVDGAHQPAGAVPADIQRGGAAGELAAGASWWRVAGQEPVLGEFLEEGADRWIGLVGAAASL